MNGSMQVVADSSVGNARWDAFRASWPKRRGGLYTKVLPEDMQPPPELFSTALDDSVRDPLFLVRTLVWVSISPCIST